MNDMMLYYFFGYGFVSPHKLSEKNKATWEGSLAKDFINYS